VTRMILYTPTSLLYSMLAILLPSLTRYQKEDKGRQDSFHACNEPNPFIRKSGLAVFPPKQRRVIYNHPLPYRIEFASDVVIFKPKISV